MTPSWLRGLVWTTILAGWISSAQAGSLHYPALGNVDLQEGTIELWLTPMVHLYPELGEDRYQGLMSLFSLEVPGEFAMHAMWYAKKGRNGVRHRLHVSLSHRKQKRALLPVPAKAVDWQRERPHHLAFTWRGKEMALYADGQRVGHRTQAVAFSGWLGNSELIIGHPQDRDAGFILHAVRVSRTAHDLETQQDVNPVARLDTLLLDTLQRDRSGNVSDDNPSKPRTTRAEVIAGLSGETGGTLQGVYRVVQTPKPGIAL